MKLLFEQIIREVLSDPNAFDKGELKYNYVIKHIKQKHEALFYDRVFFPRMERAMRLAKKWIVPEWAYQYRQIGYDKEYEADWITDTDWQDYFFDRMQSYFDMLILEDWQFIAPTKDEILELKIIPIGQLKLL